jgi:hypothetical protein
LDCVFARVDAPDLRAVVLAERVVLFAIAVSLFGQAIYLIKIGDVKRGCSKKIGMSL